MSRDRRHGTRSPAALLVIAVLAALATFAPAGRVIAAAPYLLRTSAVYRVAPDEGLAVITISATFTNSTPDAAGSFSTYTAIPLSLQAGAGAVAARDVAGMLRVVLAREASRTVATVQLRSALRYGASTTFTLSYRLLNRANPQVRLRASSLMLPLWGFGTSSNVEVRVPRSYTTRVIGASLAATVVANDVVLRSSAIADPPRWSAMLVGSRSGDLVTVVQRVPLAGGTVDLRVRAFADDREWGARTLQLVARALPVLQQIVGLPYAGVGPVVISESTPTGAGLVAEPAVGAQEIALGFDASDFVLLHQVAHVWVGSQLASERWIREGFASHFAALAARRLGISVPYDPRPQAAATRQHAIPLATWSPAGSSNASDPVTDAWAYAASWAFVDDLAASVGEAVLRRVLLRVTDGQAAYDDAAPGLSSGGLQTSPPLDSRRLLDQLEQASGGNLDAAFRDAILPAGAAALLDVRARARAAYASLVSASRGWGSPEPVRDALAAWRFDDALTLTAQAGAWLEDRDRLLEQVRSARLSTPDRLVTGWRSLGGSEQSRAELNAEEAVVAAYTTARGQIDALNPIERLGVLWGSDPEGLLYVAAGLYASGDLPGAASAIERALALDASAQGAGVVRLAAGLAALSVVAAGTLLALRRLRRHSWWPARSGAPPSLPPSA